MNDVFHRFAQRAAAAVGSPWAFALAVLAIVTWSISGPVVGFSTTWQLVIDTATTIVTFLIVFLIQNTQNRESRAVQLKLDELISASSGRNALMGVENMTDQEAAALLKRFHQLAANVADHWSKIRPSRIRPYESHSGVLASRGWVGCSLSRVTPVGRDKGVPRSCARLAS
jgi:low affinity Fe/Cu permease